ncbi:50S ribosomal protein L11 [Candidatus Woesearchaeota archaeon]|nr:50S ribosomal protein L11 [Candidatus Woesearchaeota archaeon]
MTKESVDILIEGGKATAAPPLGPALGPLGVNIGQVVIDINKKTESFKGMQVPVKVTVDSDTKKYDISIGTPPASALIKKEAGIAKGASNPKTEKVADLSIEQIIKIAKMKEDSLLGKNLKEKIKEIIGTCQAMGVLVGGEHAHKAIDTVNSGKYDEEIRTEKTEMSVEDTKKIEEERKKLQEDLKVKRDEYIAAGKQVLSSIENKSSSEKRKKLEDADIPAPIINELVPPEKDEKKN